MEASDRHGCDYLVKSGLLSAACSAAYSADPCWEGVPYQRNDDQQLEAPYDSFEEGSGWGA